MIHLCRAAGCLVIMSFENCIALITGAGRGIGRSIALGYANAGASLVIVGRNSQDLAAVALEISNLGRKVVSISADLSDPSIPKKVVDRVLLGSATLKPVREIASAPGVFRMKSK